MCIPAWPCSAHCLGFQPDVSPAAAVRLIPLAQGVPLLVFPAPPRSQCPPCLLLAIGPIGPNLKNQYACEEQMMQLQLSINNQVEGSLPTPPLGVEISSTIYLP